MSHCSTAYMCTCCIQYVCVHVHANETPTEEARSALPADLHVPPLAVPLINKIRDQDSNCPLTLASSLSFLSRSIVLVGHRLLEMSTHHGTELHMYGFLGNLVIRRGQETRSPQQCRMMLWMHPRWTWTMEASNQWWEMAFGMENPNRWMWTLEASNGWTWHLVYQRVCRLC